MTEDKKDVKTEETQNQDTSPDSAKEKVDTEKVDETTVDETIPEESRTIPYAVFKERNEKLREAERKITEMAKEKEDAVNAAGEQYQTYYEGEIAKIQRKQAEPEPEPYEVDIPVKNDEEITKLNDQISNMAARLDSLTEKEESRYLTSELKKLQAVYPEMDKEHVLAVKKSKKDDWDLDECAEYSHKHFEKEIKTRYDKMMETKKEAAKTPIFTEEGKINIKPEEKPKSWKEATDRLYEWAEKG